MGKVQKLKEWVLLFVGMILVLVGCAFVLSPFPVGWVFISSGLLLLIMVNIRIREFTKKEIEKHPKIEKRLPKKVRDLLNKE